MRMVLKDESWKDLGGVEMTAATGTMYTGLDLLSLSDEEVAALRQEVLDRCVIVLRGQKITADALLEFALRWGDLWSTPYGLKYPGHDEILQVVNVPRATKLAEIWHSDATCMAQPPAISMLAAQELPPVGGDTMFANQYLAFESLSEGLKDLLLDLRAVHRDHLVTASYDLSSDPIEACHPVVRAHPETGRRALFLNALFVERFEGWTVEESQGLLQHLYLRSSAVELCYRHRWEDGDVVIFDNRGSLHYAVHDHGDATRVLYRATTAGDRPAPAERRRESLGEAAPTC